MSTTGTNVQLQQAISLIEQHKDQIRQTLGSPPTGVGTSFSPKSSFSTDDVRRLTNSLGIDESQAQQVAELWPVYQFGYMDGASEQQNSKS